jgi:dephospho-CoA kinase
LESLEKAILIVGRIASGKSTIAELISSHYHLPIASFGSYLKSYSLSKGLSVDRADLQNLGEDFIRKDPKSFLTEVIKFSSDRSKVMIFEGVRHKIMFELIKQMCPKAFSIYVDVSDATRLERFLARQKDIDVSKSKSEFMATNSHFVESEIVQLKGLCDYVVSVFEDASFRMKLNSFLSE